MIATSVSQPADTSARSAVSPVLIRRAAVLGAGTMGSRIAAHLANARRLRQVRLPSRHKSTPALLRD